MMELCKTTLPIVPQRRIASWRCGAKCHLGIRRHAIQKPCPDSYRRFWYFCSKTKIPKEYSFFYVVITPLRSKSVFFKLLTLHDRGPLCTCYPLADPEFSGRGYHPAYL